MRRRSRPRVVWLPPTNANSIDNVSAVSGVQAFRVDVTPFPGVATGEIPVVIDGDLQDPLGASSLSDVENSGYRLRRVVGKIWVRMDQSDESSIEFCIVTAALIVRRIETDTGASLAQLTLQEELIEVTNVRNYGDPWIWRRSWLIGNNSSPGLTPLTPTFPMTNEFMSALEGPHVDQKTARIIGPEERLFLDVTVRSNSPGDPNPEQIPASVLVISDLRVLASMRPSTGNRRNASR